MPQRLDAGVLYAIRDKRLENFAIIAAKYMIMKNLRFFLLALMSAALLWACGGDEGGEPAPEPPGPGVDPNAVEITNGSFEDGLAGWTRVDFYNGGKVAVEVAEGDGVNGGRCIKIQQFPENGKCGVGIKQKRHGTWSPTSCTACTPRSNTRTFRRAEAAAPFCSTCRKSSIGAPRSSFTAPTSKTWTSLYADFLSQDDGTAEIVCALGFRYGGTTNGGYSTGTVYFDNVSVVKVTDELFMQESEHIRLFVEPSQVYASAKQITEWLANLDKMYMSYAELMGATPHEGRKLAILSSRGLESGYW